MADEFVTHLVRAKAESRLQELVDAGHVRTLRDHLSEQVDHTELPYVAHWISMTQVQDTASTSDRQDRNESHQAKLVIDIAAASAAEMARLETRVRRAFEPRPAEWKGFKVESHRYGPVVITDRPSYSVGIDCAVEFNVVQSNPAAFYEGE